VVACETGLTARMAEDVVAGFALDAADWLPRSEADLLRYCYHVAGAVGVMMAVVMGVDPRDEDTLDRACDLGLAFQLANIARDLCEDYAAGRCYVPAEWLAEADIPPGEHMKPHYRAALLPLVRRMTDLAAGYEQAARIGAARLGFRQRWAVLSAAGIYGAIGRKVAAAGAHAWDHRVGTSKHEKLGFVARALVQAVLPAPRGVVIPATSRREIAYYAAANAAQQKQK
jgi:phytoene synthase